MTTPADVFAANELRAAEVACSPRCYSCSAAKPGFVSRVDWRGICIWVPCLDCNNQGD